MRAKPSRCDICARTVTTTKIRSFSLVASARKPNGEPTSRSAGRIDLCGLCWGDIKRAHAPKSRPVAMLPKRQDVAA